MILFFLLNIGLLFEEIKPPGTRKIGDLYIDKTEILNIHWLEYQYYKKQELPEDEYWRISPDSSNNWYESPDRRFEPITLISYEQALDFCKWRSEIVSKKLGTEVTYRLPTIEEWDLIANTYLNENSQKIIKQLDKLEKQLNNRNDQYSLFQRESPRNEIYDLFFNVTEMTSTKGVAKGGNNYDMLKLEKLTIDIKYGGPNPYLGFRCIAEIKNDGLSR